MESVQNALSAVTKKLAPRREGPFEITEVLGPVTYRLRLPEHWKIHPVFHAYLLSPYIETKVHGPINEWPLPDLVDGEPEYEVEAILAHRSRGRRYQFLVKWKGWEIAENTWEPERNLGNAMEILQGYKKTHRPWSEEEDQ